MDKVPEQWDLTEWANLLVFCKMNLNIGPQEFWQLTWGEFWPLWNKVTGKVVKPMSRRELENLEGEWASGRSRRNSDTANGGDKLAQS